VAFRRRACTVLRYLDPQPSDRILDDGCGLGFYLHLLARLTPCAVWGVDRDEARLATAAADLYAAKTRRLRADVTDLPFREATFDKVISSEVLEHLDDDNRAMREVARVLKPRGVCAITVPNANYPAAWDPINYVREGLGFGHFSKGPLTGIWTDHRRLYSSRQIVDLVEGAGLSVTDVRLTISSTSRARRPSSQDFSAGSHGSDPTCGRTISGGRCHASWRASWRGRTGSIATRIRADPQ
jgi:SAM-dependent methyltransferase